jgi:glucose-6-phosphate-specific signal transduction histidine kinase
MAAGVAVALYVIVFVLSLVASSTADDIVVLYALPIALLAVTFGRRGGAIGAAAGIGLFVVAAQFTASGTSALGWATRAIAMVLLGFLLGDAADRLTASERRARREELARERLEEEQWRRHEALALHDSVVQGIAAGIWMLDVGRNEQALEALTSTMTVAQQLVSDFLGPWPIEPGELRRDAPPPITATKAPQPV